jgi:hypothetical protein
MCLLILEIIMLIVGLIGLIGGKLSLRGFPMEGKRARIAGLIMALPLPLAFGAGLLIGVLISAGVIPSSAASAASAIELVITLGCLGGAFLYAYLTKPAPGSNIPPSPPPPTEPPTINPQ